MFYKIILFLLIISISFAQSFSNWEDQGDSVIVTTFTFDSAMVRTGSFEFPPLNYSDYEKIIMEYTLKCDPSTTRDNFDCGEWDYLTYTFITDSTGKYDSVQYSQPVLKYNNITPGNLYYKNEETYKHYKYSKSKVVIKNINSEDIAKVNSDFRPTSYLKSNNRFQFIIKADEISFQDSTNKNISSFNLFSASEEVFTLNNLKVKLLNIDDSTFKNGLILNVDEAEELHFSDTEFKVGEATTIYLNKIFKWNRFKYILVDLQFDANSDYKLSTEKLKSDLSQNVSPTGSHLYFNQGDYIELPKSAFENINKEITVAFWYYGDQKYQPRNNFNIGAFNDKNQKVINIHLPYSNENIYWDCGQENGSSDRIFKKSTNSNLYKSKWNHYTFTKNANTGEMSIYINGELFQSANDKTFDMSGITKFKLGSNALGTAYSIGSYDNFAIFNKSLDANTIKTNYYKQEIDSHPNKDNLILFYDLNSGTGEEIIDKSGNEKNAMIYGLPMWVKNNAKDVYSGAIQSNRPQIELINGNYETENEQIEIEYSVKLPKTTVSFYEYQNLGRIVNVDIFDSVTASFRKISKYMNLNLNAKGFEYIYNSDDVIIDSIEVGYDEELTQSINYWYNPIVRYEIERFITPYGIGLDLGEEGFTWKFDVTHWAPLLHDWINLQSGNRQELLDIRFIMVKGTPARNVINISKLWDENAQYTKVVTDEHMSTINVFKIIDEASSYVVQTRSSGHNFNGPDGTDNCAEFCDREHSLSINGSKEFSWRGWKECGDNPVFPQGGTWLLDRTDWCPGAGVNSYYHEITNFVNPGDIINIDYNVNLPSGSTPYGNWWFRSYLFSYDTINNSLDAGIYEIISPSNHDEFSRLNPVCNGARFILENRGSETINKVNIEYGLKGYEKFTYTWEGELLFNEKTEVELPIFTWNKLWEKDTEHIFEIELKEVNDKTDQYLKNNTAWSEFEATKLYSSDFELRVRTNSYLQLGIPSPYSWKITNDSGDEFLNIDNPNHNTAYDNKLDLEPGCYQLEFTNSRGWGLDYWPVRQYIGSGSLQIYNNGTLSKVFNPDFGNQIKYSFRIGILPRINFSKELFDFNNVKLGETQTKNLIIKNENDETLRITSIDSTLFKENGKSKGFHISLNKELVGGDIILEGTTDSLIISISFTPMEIGEKEASLKIVSNSDKNPLQYIDLTGFAYDDNNTKPQALYSQDKIDFGNVKLGTKDEISFDIIAANDAGLIIDSITVRRGDFFNILNIEEGTSFNLTKDEKMTVNVEFEAIEEKRVTDFIYVYSNDEEGRKTIRLSGTGVIIKSVNETIIPISVSIINNPVSDILNINISNYSNINTARFEIWDLSGKKIEIISNLELIGKDYYKSFPISHLKSGAYFLTVNIGNNRINKKFIKN